jgi:small subunit ribosomal protein S3
MLARSGVKVWIYKGDLTARELAAQQAAAPNRPSRGPRRDGADRPARARRPERTEAPAEVSAEATAQAAPAAEAVATPEGENN